jgi:5-methylcytosine-specific restriction endonuclease McrA
MMSESKNKRKPSQSFKNMCWSIYVGDTEGTTKCLCCKHNDIKRNDFTLGHVIAESKGGSLTKENVRPICSSCNLYMGTQHMEEYMRHRGFGTLSGPLTNNINSIALSSI